MNDPYRPADPDKRPSEPSQARPPGRGGGKWSPPDPATLAAEMPGYAVVELLGRGGMGAVYKAVQINLDRLVAIKILPAALEEDDEMGFVERFRQEARSMAKLSHPSIVAVHDFGQTPSGLLFFAMEFVEGMDIQQYAKLSGGRLDPDHALAICAHVLDALSYAHAKGIVHRDIKPANVLIDTEGRVRVADFGLAKRLVGDGEEGSALQTMTGYAMGTPVYMAPESLEEGVKVDHRADLYAVGVMLYQLLTGKLPQGMFRLPSEENPAIDPRFDRLIALAMESSPDHRYQSADDFRAGLNEILSQPVAKADEESQVAPMTVVRGAAKEGRAAAPGTGRRNAPRTSARAKDATSGALIAGIVVMLALAVGAVLFLMRDRGGETPERNDPLAETGGEIVLPDGKGTPPLPGTPESATKERPFVNSLGMKFVPVPGTDVLFCIHETRCLDYGEYAEDSPRIDGSWKNQSHDGFDLPGRRGDHPVTAVSWNEAKEFCEWLGKREKREYRLPTDEEWSRAVGLGALESPKPGETPRDLGKIALRQFPWGQVWPPPVRAGNYGDASRRAKALPADPKTKFLDDSDGFPTTAPVMSFAPNEFGLYDMGGNVWEWVEDWLDNTRQARVRRGASWINALDSVLVSNRREGSPQDARHESLGYGIGFRVVLVRSGGIVSDSSSKAVSKGKTETVGETSPTPDVSWPPDGPNFRTFGKFRAWRSDAGMSEARFSAMKRLIGIGDVKQVHQGGNGMWVVLSGSGETLTDERPAERERKNIEKIFTGVASFYGLVDRDQNFESIVPDLEKYPDRRAPTGLKAADAYLSPSSSYALTSSGNLVFWGKSFDGINSNTEWKTRPLIPEGFKAIAVSKSEFGIAIQLDDGTLRLWRSNVAGAVPLPGAIASSKFNQFELTQNRLYGILEDGQAIEWDFREPRHRVIEQQADGWSLHATCGRFLIYFLTPEGTPRLFLDPPPNVDVLDVFDPVLPYLRGVVPGHLSMRVEFDKDGSTALAYLLWFDGPKLSPSPTSAVIAKQSSSPDRDARLGAQAGFQSDPEFITRLTNYNRARQAQLGDLASKYLAAIIGERDASRARGSLAESGAAEAAHRDASAVAREIEELGTVTELVSLTLPPPVGEGASPRLKELHDIFVKEAAKVEGSLLASLDQSLESLQRSWVQGARLDEAKELESYRRQMMERLPAAAAAKPVAKSGEAKPVPDKATKDQPFVNHLGMKFVPVPGTKVLFCIHEVRYLDYKKFFAERPRENTRWKNARWGPLLCGFDDPHPVVSVTRGDAEAFCEWLSEKDGVRFRLPTDEEWSRAVGGDREEKRRSDTTPEELDRAGSDLFPWGGAFPPSSESPPENLADTALKDKIPREKIIDGYTDGFPTTAPVMSFPPNALGIHDLGGNVKEWVSDWWNPKQEHGVFRGGTFVSNAPETLTVAARQRVAPDDLRFSASRGFRIVVELP